jgi:hypothetical protein
MHYSGDVGIQPCQHVLTTLSRSWRHAWSDLDLQHGFYVGGMLPWAYDPTLHKARVNIILTITQTFGNIFGSNVVGRIWSVGGVVYPSLSKPWANIKLTYNFSTLIDAPRQQENYPGKVPAPMLFQTYSYQFDPVWIWILCFVTARVSMHSKLCLQPRSTSPIDMLGLSARYLLLLEIRKSGK